MNPEKADALSPELRRALQPLLAALEALRTRIREYNEAIERLAQDNHADRADLLTDAGRCASFQKEP